MQNGTNRILYQPRSSSYYVFKQPDRLKTSQYCPQRSAHLDETIILGAFGCGAFMNDPQIVAQAAKNVIREYLYSFKNIEFAVYCSPRDDRNYRIFDRVLKK